MSQSKPPVGRLRGWTIFFKERAPPPAYALLAGGPILSSQIILIGHVTSSLVLWTFPAQLLLLFCLRMMDEVKDYDKDVIVHPDRPLPRGILKKQEVEFVIRVIVLALSLYSVLVGMAFGWSAGLWFAVEVLYSVLMYLEFGIGDTLDETPFFNAVLHQASIYVSAFFLSAAAGINEPYMHGKSWHVGHLGLSAFFTFEICRKLDPDLPKIKGTYLVVYGKWKTLLMTVGTIAFGAYGSWSLGLSHVLLPIEIGFLALLAVHFVVPYGKGSVQKRHKLLEGLAFLYLLFHLWGPVFIPKL